MADLVSFFLTAGMGEWMDSENEIKVGDKLICVETLFPKYEGTVWTVLHIFSSGLLRCESHQFNYKLFFDPTEVTHHSPLMEALLCQT